MASNLNSEKYEFAKYFLPFALSPPFYYSKGSPFSLEESCWEFLSSCFSYLSSFSSRLNASLRSLFLKGVRAQDRLAHKSNSVNTYQKKNDSNCIKSSSFLFFLFILGMISIDCAYGGIVMPVPSSDPKIPSTFGKIKDTEMHLKNNTLLIIDHIDKEKTHSTFIQMLTEIGMEVETKVLNKKGMKLKYYDQHVYQNILILADKVDDFYEKSEEYLSVSTLINAVDSKRNIFVCVGEEVGDAIRNLAKECGVDFYKKNSKVVDYFSHYKKDNSNNNNSENNTYDEKNAFIVKTDNYIKDTPILSDIEHPILYKGTGQKIESSNKVFAILRGTDTSMTITESWNLNAPSSDTVGGEDIILVSAMQADNNARALFSGSLDLFSNEFFSLNEGNKQFAKDVLQWTFKRSGVLKWSNLKHHKVNEDVSPYVYRMKDEIKFSIDIHQWEDGYWVPYKNNDVQIEYVMLDPHIRDFLDASPRNDSPTFQKIFKAPDVYGVFKFVIHYERRGYTTIHVESLAPLRNFKHNDYERFLWCALPYYGSSIASLIGVLIFAILFLYHSDEKKMNGKVKPVEDQKPASKKNI